MDLALLDADLTLIRAAFVRGDVGDARDYATRLAGKLKAAHRTVDPAEANYVGISDEAIRRVVDPPFTALAASLDAAYYQGWKQGVDVDWHGYNRLGTVEESKAQFDRLSGLIWHEYAIALDVADQLRDPADRIPGHRQRAREDGTTKRQEAEAWKVEKGLSLPVTAQPPTPTRRQLDDAKALVSTQRTARASR